MCSSVTKEIGNMKVQIEKLEEKLNKKVDAISTQNEKTIPKLDEMKKEMEKSKTYAQALGTSEGSKAVTKFATCVANTQKKITDDREERQNNVIIFNMNEEEGEDEAGLANKFSEFCSAVTVENKCKTIIRIGKKNSETNVKVTKDQDQPKKIRPIRVTFSANWDKRIFLSKLRNLKGNDKYNNVRVQHDMGIDDRAENKRLLKEVYELNQHEANPNYKYKVRGPPWAMTIIKVKKKLIKHSIMDHKNSQTARNYYEPNGPLNTICFNNNNISNNKNSSTSNTKVNGNNNINCMLVNTRSINNKVYKLTELLVEQDIDICCVTETWLKEESGPIQADLKREGYDVISCSRAIKKGGGLAFISLGNKYKTTLLKSLKFKMFEILEVMVVGIGKNIRFSIIYRTGYLNKNDKLAFFTELNLQLNSLLVKDSVNIVLGDFNIRLNNNDNLTLDFLDIMELKGFRQIISGATHREGGS